MPVPIDPETTDDLSLLQEMLKTPGFLPKYYADVTARIAKVTEDRTRVREAMEAVEKAKASVKVVEPPKPKAKGKLDSRSFEHAAKNGAVPGGVGAGERVADTNGRFR